MSALGLAALAVAQADLAANIHGGQPRRFEGPEVNARLAAVHLGPGSPWCAAEMVHCFDVAAAANPELPNYCPRVASAVHLFKNAPVECVVKLPAPGDVFMVIHADNIHGHCGIVESVTPDGQTITSVEGDTNADGSSTGDAMGQHTWTPSEEKRGRLLGYVDFGYRFPAAATS